MYAHGEEVCSLTQQDTKSIIQDWLYTVIYCYFLYHILKTTISVPHVNVFSFSFIK